LDGELWKVALGIEDTGISFNEYQALAQRTSANKEFHGKLMNGVLGLNGEAGEAADVVKKHMYQGHPLDQVKLIKELGDVLWYVAETCEALGIPMETVARANIKKLYDRYPEGFTPENSMNRVQGDV